MTRYSYFLAAWLRLRTVMMKLCPGLRQLLIENKKLREENIYLWGKIRLMGKDAQSLRSQRIYLLEYARQLEVRLESLQESNHGLLDQVHELIREQQ